MRDAALEDRSWVCRRPGAVSQRIGLGVDLRKQNGIVILVVAAP
jgi:hypothetical protein